IGLTCTQGPASSDGGAGASTEGGATASLGVSFPPPPSSGGSSATSGFSTRTSGLGIASTAPSRPSDAAPPSGATERMRSSTSHPERSRAHVVAIRRQLPVARIKQQPRCAQYWHRQSSRLQQQRQARGRTPALPWQVGRYNNPVT